MNGKAESSKGLGGFKLEIPLDASRIEGFEPGRRVKVAVQNAKGSIHAQLVEINKEGKGVASFSFAEKPDTLSLVVGPPDASDEEIFGLETLRVDVPARLWKERQLLYPVVRIPAFYWHWWWRWCRTFSVRGRVVCPDGRPVPGAKVCAFDVDAWWWWSSKQQLGCDTTDQNGAFEIKFRWCCGWWPWWWWRTRVWYLEPSLIQHIGQILQHEPLRLPIPIPDPAPDARIFERFLGQETFAKLNLARHAVASRETRSDLDVVTAETALQAQRTLAINPSVLAELREPLVARLPRAPELERLRIWPWWPWQPWQDCTPDLIFRVTQDCAGPGTVIIDEGHDQARWNIPTSLDVTLVANDKACCLATPGDCIAGNCAVLTNVCGDPIYAIGGNPGAAAAPVGYLNPGLVADTGDRPYAGAVLIQGDVGCDVDYYEFQQSDDGGATWHDLPADAVGGFAREYWIPADNTFHQVPMLTSIDGRNVFESRHHYEATHDPGSWDVTRFWMETNDSSLMWWLTQTPFLNGTHRLRIKGWQLVGGHLANPQNLDFLPTCSTQTPAELVLRIDNQPVGEGGLLHPPSSPNHPCGAGTVHTCTLEPDTDFLNVRIVRRDANGLPTGEVVEVGACGVVNVGAHDLLQVDFLAHDPEGHLAFYTLHATYGENLSRNLLGLPGVVLMPLAGAPVAAAEQVGPSYHLARRPNPPSPPPEGGATAPIWRGGAIRFEVPAAGANGAFPTTCCYQLELRAHKRTVVSCDHGFWGHANTSQYSFMIVV